MATVKMTSLRDRRYLPALIELAMRANSLAEQGLISLPVAGDEAGQRRPDVVSVLQLATRYERDADHVLHWYTGVVIESLNGYTAEQLVGMGRSRDVLDFLYASSSVAVV